LGRLKEKSFFQTRWWGRPLGRVEDRETLKRKENVKKRGKLVELSSFSLFVTQSSVCLRYTKLTWYSNVIRWN